MERACPHCGEGVAANASFCESCGKAVPAVAETSPRVVSGRGAVAGTRVGKRFQSASLERKAHSAAGALLVVAILMALGCVLIYTQLKDHFDHAEVGGTAKALMAAQVAMTLAYFGLWAWARRAPLPAAIVGLVLYISLHLVNAVIEPESIARGIIIKVIIIVVLIKAIDAGVQHRRLQASSG